MTAWTQPDAVCRFVRHEPGVHVVLFGTSSPEHLRTNVDSRLKPPLPEADRQKLADLFGHLFGVGLELATRGEDLNRVSAFETISHLESKSYDFGVKMLSG
jgi:hypothetical protein